MNMSDCRDYAGFDIMRGCKLKGTSGGNVRYDLNLPDIANWRSGGSVVVSC